MNEDFINNDLSAERFGRYLEWAGYDQQRALELYALNTRISESFYTPLQTLEVCLRNRINQIIGKEYGDRWIIDHLFPFSEKQANTINNQVTSLTKKFSAQIKSNPNYITNSHFVANFNFGFWTQFFDSSYDREWRSYLHKLAKTDSGKSIARKEISIKLINLKSLRNRIAHHEPIIHRNLLAEWQELELVLNWLSRTSHDWCRQNNRVAIELDRWQTITIR